MKIPRFTDKPLHWVGSSKKDLLDFPDEVVGDVGYALGVVQQGGMPPSAKPWKGEAPGCSKLRKITGAILSAWSIPFDLSGRYMCCIVSRRNRLQASGRQARMWS